MDAEAGEQEILDFGACEYRAKFKFAGCNPIQPD